MIDDDECINRYGAKFFIGQLVRIIKVHGNREDEDVDKVGIIDGIVGCLEDGFEYSLYPTESNMSGWFDETDLDFINECERVEWDENGEIIRKILNDNL